MGLPVSAALVAAEARTPRAVALNAAAFLAPQAAVALAVFFLFAHSGQGGGPGLLLATGEFWHKLGATFALVLVLVGAASFVFRLARR